MSAANPYPNRPYPVGQLEYPLEPDRAEKITSLKGKHVSMLEFGEQEVMFDMPRIVGLEGNYYNLGHAMGGSALLLARGLEDQGFNNSTVWSVDTFEYFKNHWQQANDEIARQGIKQIELCKGTTSEWVNWFRDGKRRAAFVFIDADHSYEGVREDCLNYGPLVRVGGVMAFHDTNQEPSHRVIEELLGPETSWQQILHVNRIRAFRRV